MLKFPVLSLVTLSRKLRPSQERRLDHALLQNKLEFSFIFWASSGRLEGVSKGYKIKMFFEIQKRK